MRKSLTKSEIKKILVELKKMPNSLRNRTLCMIMYSHGLRVSECCNLRWSDWNREEGKIYCRRLKGSISGWQNCDSDETRLLAQLKLQSTSTWLFNSKKGTPLSDRQVRYIFSEVGTRLNFDFPLHPHMLKHSAAVNMLESGIDLTWVQRWLGHKDIRNTMIYLEEAGIDMSKLKSWKA